MLRHTICAKIRNNASRRIMPSPGLCYLCRLLCPTESRPCPLITVNDKICQMCLNTYLQAEDLVDAFHLPAPVAAQRHGMSPRKFRTLCKRRGITRWPYRLLRHPSVTATRPVDFVEDLMADLVTCLAAEEDLRAVPTVVPTDLPAEVPTATPTPVLTAVPIFGPTVEPTFTSTREPTAVTTPATVRVANLETALDGWVKQGNLIKRLSHLELNTTGEQGTGPVLKRIAKLEAVLGVSGAPLGS